MPNSDIYQQNIIEHYQSPHNWGQIPDAQIEVEGANLSCGDELKFFINIKRGVIDQIKFNGQSCAICTASASMLTDYVLGKTAKEILDITPDKIKKLIGIELSPIRLKCALLPLQTLKDPKIVGESL